MFSKKKLYDFYINYIKLAFFLRIFTYSLEREEDQYKRNLSEIFTVYKLLIRRLGGGGVQQIHHQIFIKY